jgi:hypothetical protein
MQAVDNKSPVASLRVHEQCRTSCVVTPIGRVQAGSNHVAMWHRGWSGSGAYLWRAGHEIMVFRYDEIEPARSQACLINVSDPVTSLGDECVLLVLKWADS